MGVCERGSEVKPAMVYDGGIRDNGTPFYARVALANILREDPAWYTEAGVVSKGHPFYIHVDDGRDDLSVDSIPHPWGYWAVDSHLGPDIRIEKARKADLVWCAQKPFVETLAKEGIKATWLPLACEPALHRITHFRPGAPDKDLVFVGHLQDPKMTNRLEFLDGLFKSVRNPWFEYGVFHEDMANVYARGRIGVNHAVRDDLNMRFFELACVGVPQLADARMVGLEELGFKPWVHYLPYESLDEAIEVVEDELDKSHAAMVTNSRQVVIAAHTYTHRVEQMLRDASQRGYL